MARNCNCNWCDYCALHYPAPQPIDRNRRRTARGEGFSMMADRYRYDMRGDSRHDYSGTLDIIAIASNPRNFIDAVAGTGQDGNQYVRLYDTFYSPPVPLQTVKHGNAYGYVMQAGGKEAQGIA